MASEPEKNMDAALRAYARKRREEAGAPFELHPVNRRLLQAEAAHSHAPAGRASGWLAGLARWWPRIGFAACLFVALAAIVWIMAPESGRETHFARQDQDRAAGVSVFEARPADAGRSAKETQATAGKPAADSQAVSLAARREAESVRLQDEEAARRSLNDASSNQLGFSLAPAGAPQPGQQPPPAPSGPALQPDQTVRLKMAAPAEAPALAQNNPADRPVAAGESVVSLNQQAPAQTAATPAPAPATAGRPAAGPAATAGAAVDQLTLAQKESGQFFYRQNQTALGAQTGAPARVQAESATAARVIRPTEGNVAQPQDRANAQVPPAALPSPPAGPQPVSQSFVAGTAREADADSAERKRFAQVQAPTPRGATAPADGFLTSFELERVGDRLRIVEADGSVYEGRLARPAALAGENEVRRQEARPTSRSATSPKQLEASRARAVEQPSGTAVTFQVSGTSRRLQQPVVIEGTLLDLPSTALSPGVSGGSQRGLTPAAPAASPAPGQPTVGRETASAPLAKTKDAVQQQSGPPNRTRLQGKARIGNDREVPVDAYSVGP